MADDYKRAKEAFVSGTTGSTMWHVHSISMVALTSIALYSVLRMRDIRLNFFSSWMVLVAPLLLSMTVFANSPFLLSLLLCLPICLVMFLLPPRELGSPLPSNTSSLASPGSSKHPPLNANQLNPLPALTTYRAHMMLMTVLAILAVDFRIFPRTLAKCETFGVSLMDLGVGSFVFSQGVVSAIPILKDPGHLKSPIISKLLSVMRKSSPIIILGLVRVLLVKATDYPEHVSEYGVHWNFFLTLALLPILQVILHPLILRFSVTFLGLTVGIAHQLLLSYAHLQDYVLDAPRTSWISANKEGVVSLPGYLSIHLLGLSIGTLILPPSPSWFRRMMKHRKKALEQRSIKKNDDARAMDDNPSLDQVVPLSYPRSTEKTSTELCAYALLWLILCGMVGLMKIGIGAGNKEALGMGLGKGVSRRMANLPYIFWVAAFNTSFILAYFVLDMIFYPSPDPPKSKVLKSQNKKEELLSPQQRSNQQVIVITPPLLDAINRNGLVLFLLANICTGLINLSVRTIEASDSYALIILGVYTYTLCAAAWIVKGKRILKL